MQFFFPSNRHEKLTRRNAASIKSDRFIFRRVKKFLFPPEGKSHAHFSTSSLALL